MAKGVWRNMKPPTQGGSRGGEGQRSRQRSVVLVLVPGRCGEVGASRGEYKLGRSPLSLVRRDSSWEPWDPFTGQKF